jgi:hypothetical protein
MRHGAYRKFHKSESGGCQATKLLRSQRGHLVLTVQERLIVSRVMIKEKAIKSNDIY